MIFRLTLFPMLWMMTVAVSHGFNVNSQNHPAPKPQQQQQQKAPRTNSVVPGESSSTALGYAEDPASVSVEESLIGQVLNGQYVLTRNIPVASQKCQIFEAHHIEDEAREHPVIVKLSHHLAGIDLEFQNFLGVASRVGVENQHLFVRVFDKVEATPLTQGQAGIVMERGEDNLRFIIRDKGAYRGEKLRKAMKMVIEIVAALHEHGLVWTEIKAENFVVQKDGSIKGIDLESVIGHQDLLKMYTAEACPPEFPVDDMYTCLPKIRMEYSFDMWGLGMTLFEMATGKPFYAEGLTDLEFIKDKLRYPDRTAAEIDARLLAVNPQARKLIKKCLEVDPTQRWTCQEILNDRFFTGHAAREGKYIQTQESFSKISSNFGIPEGSTPKPVDAPKPVEVATQAPVPVHAPTDVTAEAMAQNFEAQYEAYAKQLSSDTLEELSTLEKHASTFEDQYARYFEEAQSYYFADVDEEANAPVQLPPPLPNCSYQPTPQLELPEHLEALLESINLCAKHDPNMARKLLFVLDDDNFKSRLLQSMIPSR